MITFVHRILGALALDATTYEEIEADRRANVQALAVVMMSALAAGVGVQGFGARAAAVPFIASIALIAWMAWALLTFEIGVRLLRAPETRSDVGELLRTIGFASAPGVLRVLGVFPLLAAPAFAVSAVWMLAAMIVAVRQALDYTSTARAIAVCAIGWVLTVAIIVAWGWATPILSAQTVQPPSSVRVSIVRAGKIHYGSAVLIRRVESAGSSELYFVTSAAHFRTELGQALPRATSIVVEMPGARVTVHPEDVALSGSMVNLAVLTAVTTADVAGGPALTLSVPDPGLPFVIEGFDKSGQAVRATARVSRVATLLLMGAPAMTVSGCAGATAIADREAFGIVSACDEGELPRVVPFAAIADWIARRVPGGLTLRGAAVLTGFELNQRELPGPLLTVSCGEPAAAKSPCRPCRARQDRRWSASASIS